jgi:hypothetical protein
MNHHRLKAVMVVMTVSSLAAVYAVAGADLRGQSKSEFMQVSMASKFALCKTGCKTHYVGFARQNSVRLGDQQDSVPPQVLRIFPGVSDAKTILESRGRTAVRVEQENGNFVISEHRLETLRIGNLRKSETMIAQVTDQVGGAEAQVQLVWGDTLTVRSSRLARGAPVTLNVQRNIGGFGNPASQGAYYNGQSQTLMDGNVIADLDFTIKKYPGDGQKDQITGTDKLKYTIQAKVGQVLRLEGSLKVTDGVKSAAKSQQILDGADAATYMVSIDEKDACVTSSSGQLNAGNCN